MTRLASDVLSRVVAGELCTGCGLCAAIAPGAVRMTESADGFLRPEKSAVLSPTENRAITEACPGSRLPSWHSTGTLHPYWGPYLSCETGWATDPAVRLAGSSGGMLSALAVFALEDGLVDAVIHVGADPARPTRNQTMISTTREQVLAGAGSRYAPSSPLEGLDELTQSGLRYMFIGKPCDVSALELYLQSRPELGAYFPLRMAFFCGGIPSFGGTDKILAAMGIGYKRLQSFRYRGNGWPGEAVAIAEDGEIARMSYAKSWGGFLSKEVQYRCKICPDAVGGAADVAAADAWYGDATGYPSFDEHDGRSLVLARSEAGSDLLARARKAGVIAGSALPISEIERMQPSQARRKRLAASRLAAAQTLFQPVPECRGLAIGIAAKRAGVLETLRSYLGSLKRIISNQR